MYAKNYSGDDISERFGVPPDYGGSAIQPGRDGFGISGGTIPPPCPERPHDGCGCIPPPPPPSHGGLLDRFSSEDLLIFGAAAFLVFGNGDDIICLGLLLALILL